VAVTASTIKLAISVPPAAIADASGRAHQNGNDEIEARRLDGPGQETSSQG
jgi:hypothetical protein